MSGDACAWEHQADVSPQMEIQNLAALEQGSPLTLRLYGHQDGREEDIFVPLSHSLTSREIEW